MLRSTRAESCNAASVADSCDADLQAFRSVSYSRVCSQAARFARAGHAPVLIEGESGTGKTQLARRLHRMSSRATAPFEYVVLSAVEESLAGSELFGHVSGAFTDARHNRAGHFATATGGTLFLDEIAKASRAVQQKLLHAVEYGEIRPVGSDRDVRVDVRIIAASNVPLSRLSADGDFLSDLYARLSAFRIELPPLRNRRADIPIFAEHFVRLHAADAGYGILPTIHPELIAALQRASWPNNIRQLDATMHRILVDASGAPQLRLEHCIDDLDYLRRNADIESFIEPLSAEVAEAAIVQAGGSISGAARLLGVDRSTVHRARKRRSKPQDSPPLVVDHAWRDPDGPSMHHDRARVPASAERAS